MRRTLLLLAALLIAAVGTALVYAYVRGADARAAAGQEEVQVLVAAQDMPVGTAAAKVQVTQASVVRKDQVPNVLKSMQGITGRLTVGLLKGQQISSKAFGPGTGTSAGPGMAAVPVTVATADQAAGTVVAGDKVDIYQLGNRPEPVLTGAEVLAVGGPNVPATTVLFNVNSDDVVKLLTARASGTLVLIKQSG